MKEDKSSWISFFQWLRGRGLDRVKLIVGDKCRGMLESVGEVFPEAKYQRCTVHFYRNVFFGHSEIQGETCGQDVEGNPSQESKRAAREKATTISAELQTMRNSRKQPKRILTVLKRPRPAMISPVNIGCGFVQIERLNREIRRRTRVVGTFPDGISSDAGLRPASLCSRNTVGK